MSSGNPTGQGTGVARTAAVLSSPQCLHQVTRQCMGHLSSVNPAARSSCRLKSSRCHQETQASHPQNQLGGSFLQLHLGIKRGWEQFMWALYKGSSADASTKLPRGSRSAFTSLGSCRTYPRARGMNALTAICKMILNPGSPKEVSECCRHWDWMLWTYFSGIDWPENCTGQRPCMCWIDDFGNVEGMPRTEPRVIDTTSVWNVQGIVWKGIFEAFDSWPKNLHRSFIVIPIPNSPTPPRPVPVAAVSICHQQLQEGWQFTSSGGSEAIDKPCQCDAGKWSTRKEWKGLFFLPPNLWIFHDFPAGLYSQMSIVINAWKHAVPIAVWDLIPSYSLCLKIRYLSTLNPKNELLHPYKSCILKQGVGLFDFGGMGLCSIFSLNPPRYSLLIVEWPILDGGSPVVDGLSTYISRVTWLAPLAPIL